MSKNKYIPVNEFTISDKNINIMILRRPKQRYRTIIRSYYRQRKRETVIKGD